MLRENIKLTKLGKLMIEYFDIFRQSGCKQEGHGQPRRLKQDQTGIKLKLTVGFAKRFCQFWDCGNRCESSWSIEQHGVHSCQKGLQTYTEHHRFFSCLTTLPWLLALYSTGVIVTSGKFYCQPQTMWWLLPLLNSYSSIIINHIHLIIFSVTRRFWTWPSQYLLHIYFLLARSFWNIKDILIYKPFFRVVIDLFQPRKAPPAPLVPLVPASDRFQRNMLAKLCRGDFRKTLLRATEDLAFEDLRKRESVGRSKGGWINSHQEAHYPLVI